ncbi:DNA polymerase I [bacterium]|nr:DNA polymerase I [bacterium]
MSEKNFLLIDGHALAYRYYFALERTAMKTSDNQPTWAVWGFFKAIFDLLENQKIRFDNIAVTFDVSRHTFRTDMYADYKANRESMPDSMHSQMELIMEGLKAFNIPIYTKEGFEADDVIGTISSQCRQKQAKTYILTGDRDSFQLVDREGFVTVIVPSKGELIQYDWYKVFEKMGVYPYQIIDYKALSGDTSDNIPGIKGVGDKSAVKLLSRFDTLEGIYEHLDEMTEKALKNKLIEGKESAYLSKTLATIKRDLDIDFDFCSSELELPVYDDVIEFFKKNQFYSFLKNSDKILKNFKVTGVETAPQPQESQAQLPLQQAQTQTGQLQLGFSLSMPSSIVQKTNTHYDIVKTIVDTEQKFGEMVKKLSSQTLISLDVETTGVNPLEAELVGISVSCSDDLASDKGRVKIKGEGNKYFAWYIPVFHQFGEQLEHDFVIQNIKPLFENENIKKTFQNVKFDYNVLKKAGIEIKGIIFDTMLASYIKDSSRKHGLKVQATEHLNYFMKHFEDLGDKKEEFTSIETVAIEEAGDYAMDDAFATLALTKYWQKTLDEKELDLLYNIEVPTALVLAGMEYDGVSIDDKYLRELSAKLQGEIEEIEKRIYDEAGQSFNINSPKQVSEILFDKLNLKSNVRTRTKFGTSTNAKVLEDLAEDNKIAADILEQRHLTKLKTTYLDTLPELISAFDGRIHASFNQTITSTGRLSSSNPNMQNIPVKSELGNEIRNAFRPKNDKDFIVSADYSQVELRLLAHISRDDNLIEAFCEGEDVHTSTAAKVFGVSPEEVTKEMRRKAKAVNFGIVYGQSKYGLASALKISVFEAQEFIMKYFKTYPKVSEYMDNTIKFAYEHGYVETLWGRKRYLMTDLMSSNSKIQEGAQRAAINAPIQGTAADVMKLAMVKLKENLDKNNLKSKIILQVHDEVVLETVDTELETIKKMVVESMELNQPFLVPLKVDVAVGKSWKEN